MRVASRHMPTFARRPMGTVGWALVACFLCGLAYLAAAEPQAFILAASGFAVLSWLVHKVSQREERQLLARASLRGSQTICEFARDFDARAVDTWIVRAVYEQLQAQLNHLHPSFPVRADDRLKSDLLLDGDDVDDLAQVVEARTGRSMEDFGRSPHVGNVETVRDFVLFFQHQSKEVDGDRLSLQRTLRGDR